MLNNKSFIANELGLKVTKKVDKELYNAECKLAEAIVENKDIEKRKEIIEKVIKSSKLKIESLEKLKELLNRFEEDLKEGNIEFSVSTKKVLYIPEVPEDVNNIIGLDILTNDESDDAQKPEEVTKIEKKDAVILEDETSEVVHTFALKTMAEFKLDEFIENDGNKLLGDLQSDDINLVVFWSLKGKISLTSLFDKFINSSNIKNCDNKLLQGVIKTCKGVVEILDEAITKLSKLNASDDEKSVADIYNTYIDKISTVVSLLENMVGKKIMPYIQLLLLSSLDEFLCRELLNLDKVEDFNDDDVNKLLENYSVDFTEIAKVKPIKQTGLPYDQLAPSQKPAEIKKEEEPKKDVKEDKSETNKDETVKDDNKSEDNKDLINTSFKPANEIIFNNLANAAALMGGSLKNFLR